MDKNASITQNFLGNGWGFKLGKGLGVNGQGNIGLMKAEQDIAKSIILILSTAPGERVIRTDFGCGIHDLVFATPGPEIFGLVSYYIRNALGRWEPRVEVTEIKVEVDKVNPEILLIDVNYLICQTNDQRNLVYPFYTIPRGQD